MKKNIKTYRSLELVQAYEFKDGMEDGFEVRYYDPDQEKEDNGSISTWRIPSPTDTAEVKVPYVLCPKSNRMVMAGAGYMMVISPAGFLMAMDKEEFNEQYEPL